MGGVLPDPAVGGRRPAPVLPAVGTGPAGVRAVARRARACLVTGLRFRAGEPLDLPAIYTLERQYMADIEPDDLDGWVRATDRNLRVWIENLERTVVAEDDGRLVGYQMWTP